MHLSLHTDSPALLTLPQRSGIVIPPMGSARLRLRFEMPPTRLQAQIAAVAAGRRAPPGGSTEKVRLWVHNEATNQNEECLVFAVCYLTDFESQIAAADASTIANANASVAIGA